MSDRKTPVTWCTECGDALDEDRSCNSCLSTNAAKTVTVIQICNRLPGYLVPEDYSKARTLTAITTLKQNAVNAEAEVIELKQQLSDITAERDGLHQELLSAQENIRLTIGTGDLSYIRSACARIAGLGADSEEPA